jgi:hypothetical protein
MSDSNDVLSLSEKMDELIFWTKFSAMTTFIPILKNALRDDTDKLVYELSDGKRSTRDIAQIVCSTGRKTTHVTVGNMWERWTLLNLVIPANRKGRVKRVLSLESIGMSVPKYIISVQTKSQAIAKEEANNCQNNEAPASKMVDETPMGNS